MKSCVGCKYAEWKRTAKGSLHPSGDGMCGYPYKLPELPEAMYWPTFHIPPRPCGGYINRRKEFNDDCAYFARYENK